MSDAVMRLAIALTRRGWRLAVAESCTGGLLAARCTQLPGSSAWFFGAMVTYDNQAKQQWLGVDDKLLQVHGAVSEPVARAMALGLQRRAHSDLTLSITGIAGPGGATEDKPVGTVCFARVTPDAVDTKTCVLTGNREQVREQAVTLALEWLVAACESEK